MYVPNDSLGQKLHTYGLSYLEIFRLWFLGGVVITPIVAIAASANPLAPLGVVMFCLIGFCVHLVFLEMNPKRITVYESGINYRVGKEEHSWHWEQITDMTGTRHTFRVNGIPVLRYGENIFHVGHEPAFAVSHKTAEASRLVEFIFMKMAECQVPRYVAAYQLGKQLDFGGIFLDKNGISNKKQQIMWADVAAFRLKGKALHVKPYGNTKEINLGRIQPPSSYLILGTMDRILDTHAFANLQQTHLRGPIRWLGIPRTAVLATLLVGAIFAVIFGAALISDQYNTAHDKAERDELVTRFGADINTLCGSAKEHPDGSLSSIATHYIVVNADRDTIFSSFQDALDKSKVATSRQDLTAVICLHSKSVEVERCDYGANGKADWHISRIQEGYDISIVDVATGKTFASGAIGGPLPGDCPDKSSIGDSDIHGSPPTADKLLKWLHDLNAAPATSA